ncbi:DUF2071 domain-containing protein [Paenibacillus sp. HWE-109]|uniref:YqjF family protein n=1 Tax=Paenibacillus sp. HWE-109 TaxID=1306526 RepID=UPI001EDE7572|nr:DUF2071 domain-containing protein [Paenibacillus sp. HWE-109]UKS29784.1 DUF2071 domain-containing protein [Paenibacillus sp. HWE-109]
MRVTKKQVNGKPGVYFFSLDAHNRFAVEAARLSFHLPYFYAKIDVKLGAHDSVIYRSIRHDKRAKTAEFTAAYKPTSEVRLAVPETLEYWLTERYCLYCSDHNGSLYRGEIDHEPWPLQSAQATIQTNTVPLSFGIVLPNTPPILHFAKKLQVKVWLLEQISCPNK